MSDRARLIGLATFTNEARYLPNFFANMNPHVDGWVLLDNASTDGSREIALAQPNVLELLDRDHDDDVWRDHANHERLIRAAWEHTDGWLIAMDPDERFEREFGDRARAVMAQGDRDGVAVFKVKYRELWDRPDQMRVDGVWGRKHRAALFRAARDHAFDPRELHGYWAPLNHLTNGTYPEADLLLYHLKMIHAEDRIARRDLYERLDPDHRWQSIGYAYLCETDGIVLEPLPEGREFEPLSEA